MSINIALKPWKSKYNEKWEKFVVKLDVHRFLQYFLWSLHMCWLLARKCQSVLRMAKFMETVTESDFKKKKRRFGLNWKCNCMLKYFWSSVILVLYTIVFNNISFNLAFYILKFYFILSFLLVLVFFIFFISLISVLVIYYTWQHYNKV